MKKLSILATLALLALPAGALTVAGDYVEARTSDIYTGPCFANSEVNLAGREAIMAWRVSTGAWNGVDLSGLGVVAVVRASATLGDPHADPLPARSVLVVDDTASVAQQTALVAMARELAGDLLTDVVAVRSAPVEVRIDGVGAATVTAGEVAALRTRALDHSDHLCGNEEVYYPPLIGADAEPAVTLEHEWRGEGLDGTWKSPGKRSAFVGSFAR